jgi:hypothetical protein
MKIGRVFFIIIIFVLIYLLFRYFYKSEYTLSPAVTAGTTQQQITASSLAQNSSTGANSSNFTYSIWFYINDWNYRYSDPKVLFGRMGAPTSSVPTEAVPGVTGANPCPVVTFGAINNNLAIALRCAGKDLQNASDTTIHTCAINNVPIQAWTNLLISVYGRTLDIYMDGKLVNTCLLPGVAMIDNNADVYVTPNGGFSGWTSKFQYYPNATDPQTAWNIYRQGYGGSVFSKYNVKVAFLENGTETNSFSI